MQLTTAKILKKHRFNRMDDTLLLKKWGSRLRYFRKLHGYQNQEALAEAMIAAGYDITQPAISRAENGGLKKPQDDIFNFLKEKHGVKHDEVFSVPVDWQQKYYDLLESMKDQPGQDRVEQLEGLVSELQKQIKDLQDDKGKKN